MTIITQRRDSSLVQASETSELFHWHGFSPQADGEWARGGWIELRADGA